jgi:hypothetical protein
MKPRVLIVLAAVAALMSLGGCKVKDPPPVTERWSDSFERNEPGSDYYQTGDGYRVSGGALNARGAYNKPLWLRKKLPRKVQIDLTAWSASSDGDIKVEIFGDGQSFDPDKGGYTSTGYVLVQGGWRNTKSILAKQNEHGQELVSRASPRVTPKQKYHWRIVRDDKAITWFVDDMETPFLRYEDPRPLTGAGHEYFGFNNWEADTWFDDLVVTPL